MALAPDPTSSCINPHPLPLSTASCSLCLCLLPPLAVVALSSRAPPMAMGRSLPIFAFLVIAAVVVHAALPSQVYWNTVLPNTPMPSAIRDLLHPDVLDEKAGTSVNMLKGKPYHPSAVTLTYAASADQIHYDPEVDLFFLEKDHLQPGSKMNLHFIRTTSGATFLPRGKANSIPFSSNKLPEILNRFSIKSDSLVAGAMKRTLEECEAPANKGETKHCATSLESMVDYTTSALGTRDVRAWSTEVDREGTPKQEYTIASSGVEKLAGEEAVACHLQTYAYPVFNCHQTRATNAYMVPLVGKDGTKVKAVAVCHTDTSTWNPKHVAFKMLKVKPGTVSLCHTLPQDHVVWTPTSN